VSPPASSLSRTILRRLLPWLVSAAALGYLFGYAVDWAAIPRATEKANLPLFIGITVADKVFFFVVWGLIQAQVIRRFVEPVSTRRVLEVKAGAELVRTFVNSLADAAFALGVSQLARGRLAAVVAVVTIPFGCHFAVLLLQATAMLPFLHGGWAVNRDVTIGVTFGWFLVVTAVLGSRLDVWRRILTSAGPFAWLDQVRARDLLPFLGWFALFAVADVLIQGAATRAFGVPIPWRELAARIPLLYLALSIPSFGNFGTREITWAACFGDHAPRETLIAFALWTNAIFMVMHALIGVLFFGRALEMLRGVRALQARGEKIPEPILHDAIDP